MNKVITSLFLRLFAMNLRRGWRSDARTAWSDAIFTIDTLICLPLTCLLGLLWLLLTDWFPQTIGTFGMPTAAQAALVVASWFAVDTPLTRMMRVHKREPISPASYNGTSDRVKLALAGVISIGTCIALLVIGMAVHSSMEPR